MLALVLVSPTEEFIIATAENEDSDFLIDQIITNYEGYIDELSKLMLGKPIEKIGVVGIPEYAIKIITEIKVRFPKVPVDGEYHFETGETIRFEVEDRESITI